MKKQPAPIRYGVMLAGIVLASSVHQAAACDACNLTFADEILTGERAGSVVAKDLRRAMENQRDLPIEGFSNQMLIDLQEAKLGTPGRTTTVSSPAPRPAAATAVTTTANATTAIAAVATRELPEYMQDADFIEILERDYALETTPYSTVPQDAPHDHSVTIRLHEGKTYIGNGVVYEGFLIDGKIPGPTIIVDEGDVVEFNVVNDGMIPHGASIHSAYTQTSEYVGSIMPGTTKSVKFRAMTSGVYMYHCAPGGHAIPMHVIGGQYGMMIVRPKDKKFKLEEELGHPPNLELSIIQHELYASGYQSIKNDAAYTMLTHAVGSASRGAIGLLVVDDEAELEPHRTVLADGPGFPEAEIETYIAEAKRVISPFGIGTHPTDRPVRHGADVKEVEVMIIGNSYHPKVVEIAPGTKVTWCNEDAFTYLGGEFSGIHNAVAIKMPQGAGGFATPMLMHAESASHVFETPGEYDYICAPHPYMKGRIIVREP